MITEGQRVTFTNWLGETVTGIAHPYGWNPAEASVRSDDGPTSADGLIYHHVPVADLTPVQEAVITHRARSPKPPTFPKGSRVAFAGADGKAYEGTFVKRFSPARGAGVHYLIEVDGKQEQIFANSPVGLSVTQQKEA